MVADTVRLGTDVSIPQPQLVTFYGCSIGDGSKVGAFGVTIEDGVFIGHGRDLHQ